MVAGNDSKSGFYFVFLGFFILFVSGHVFSQAHSESRVKRKTVFSGKCEYTICFEGNILISSRTLAEVSKLEKEKLYSESDVKAQSLKIQSFYKRLGYSLVKIKVKKDKGGYVVVVNEGVLNRIYIKGLSWFKTMSLRDSILPYDIYNEYIIQDLIQRWNAQSSRHSGSYELIFANQSQDPQDLGQEINSWTQVFDSYSEMKKSAVYNLKLVLKSDRQSKGFDIGLSFNSINGLGLNTKIYNEGLFFRKDRIENRTKFLAARRGDLRRDIDRNEGFYEIENNLNYYFPSKTSNKFRFGMGVEGGIFSDQRRDLDLDSYRFYSVRVGPKVQYQPEDRVILSYGTGYEVLDVLNTEYIVEDENFLENTELSRGIFSDFELTYYIKKFEIFSEFNHLIRFRHIFSNRGERENIHEFRFLHQKTFPGRSFDVESKTNAKVLLGGIQFYDEFGLDELNFASSFGRKYFLNWGINKKIEFRKHIYGRRVQLGLRADFLFANSNQRNQSEAYIYGGSVGPGVYWMFLDTFRFNLNYAFGMLQDQTKSHDINIGLNKVF